MKVYLSAPYTASTEEAKLANTNKAIDVALDLMVLGYTVFIPHLSHFTDTLAKNKKIDLPYEMWMQQDLEWIPVCDCLVYFGMSHGVQREIEFAKNRNIPVYQYKNGKPTLTREY